MVIENIRKNLLGKKRNKMFFFSGRAEHCSWSGGNSRSAPMLHAQKLQGHQNVESAVVGDVLFLRAGIFF